MAASCSVRSEPERACRATWPARINSALCLPATSVRVFAGKLTQGFLSASPPTGRRRDAQKGRRSPGGGRLSGLG